MVVILLEAAGFCSASLQPAEPMKRGKASGDGLVGWPETHFSGYKKHFTEFDGGALRTLLTLRAVTQHVENALGAWFAASGLTPQKFGVLMLLFAEEKPITLSHLRNLLKTTQANVTGLTTGLERDGLIERRVSRDDQRVSFVSLSRSGKRALRATLPAYFALSRDSLRRISASEKKSLIALLARVAEGFAPVRP
jgi:DNA-binding MarR family transcriptional regulator